MIWNKTNTFTALPVYLNKNYMIIISSSQITLIGINFTDEESNPPKKRAVYDCPKDGCTKMFSTQSTLDSHLLLGNCDYSQKMTLHDQAKVMYSNKVNNLVTITDNITLPCNTQQGVGNVEKTPGAEVHKKKSFIFKEAN